MRATLGTTEGWAWRRVESSVTAQSARECRTMELPVSANVTIKRKIPDVCREEQVEHLDFNAFFRREGIRF